LDGFGFLISLDSPDFHSLILVIISMYLFGFEKLATITLATATREYGEIAPKPLSDAGASS